MSDLARFREHCAAMATAEHKPECPSLRSRPLFARWDWKPPTCPGCNPVADRALFARLAAEVDDYLDPHPTLREDA